MHQRLRQYLQKKVRRSKHKCLIEGEKLCREALSSGIAIDVLVYARGEGKRFTEILRHPGVQKSYVTTVSEIRHLSGVETPQGIVGLISFPISQSEPGTIPTHRRYIALDAISDPGNVGTIIRSASWYGWDGVLCGTDTAEAANEKVIRSSMGAVFHLPIWEQQFLPEVLRKLKKRGFTIIGTKPQGGITVMKTIPDKVILVIGSEAAGISPEITQLCDVIFTIQGFGKAESLNAAVCASILADRLTR